MKPWTAPTAECVKMVEALGEVKYVVLPTTGLEHKLFMKPFVNKVPSLSLSLSRSLSPSLSTLHSRRRASGSFSVSVPDTSLIFQL